MRQVLQSAGLPNSVLDKIPQVIDTCRECRQWSRPAHETIPTLRMTTRFQRTCGSRYPFLSRVRCIPLINLICCATRWHAAAVIRSKQEEELLSAMRKIWFSIHGPMQQLIIDGELGVTGPSAQAKLKRLGVAVKVRAPAPTCTFHRKARCHPPCHIALHGKPAHPRRHQSGYGVPTIRGIFFQGVHWYM